MDTQKKKEFYRQKIAVMIEKIDNMNYLISIYSFVKAKYDRINKKEQ